MRRCAIPEWGCAFGWRVLSATIRHSWVGMGPTGASENFSVGVENDFPSIHPEHSSGGPADKTKPLFFLFIFLTEPSSMRPDA